MEEVGGPKWLEEVRRRLLAWFDQEKRDLPWRRSRDPYHILVSEMMLVQTTVAAVIPYFQRFLAEFPTFADLAAADEARVLKVWEGLGYYRRARQLQGAAREVVEKHGGRMPVEIVAVRALPGVGRYMAGAILSQAFDLPEPIVEANSRRVLARLTAMEEDLATTAAQNRLWEAAGRLVPKERAGDFNQSLMELGALICTPRSPRCLICPVSEFCEGRRRGLQNEIPRTVPRAAPTEAAEACAVVAGSQQLLLVRRSGPGLWAGFWEFPTIHLSGADPAGRSFPSPVDLADGVERLTDVRAVVGALQKTISYGVTRYRVRLDAHAASTPSGRSTKTAPGPGMSEARWFPLNQLSDLTMSAASRKLTAAILRDPSDWGVPGIGDEG